MRCAATRRARDLTRADSARLAVAFDVFDIDHNGFISRDELLLMLKANHMALSDAQVAKKAAAIMRQADRDGDNRITFDEFRSACHRFPNLVFPVFDDADAARASSAPRAAGDRSDDE
jgi:Ca2+-binding EF-hand superfamily protein